jgi:hypothetical protein
MSTKDLSRTVIEGGRDRWSQYHRRYSHRRARARSLAVLHDLRAGAEPDAVCFPEREPVYRSFADKLSPATRWLERQVGRPWDRVRSELFERFDTRTTAGRHVLFDHVLPSMELERWGGGLRHQLFIGKGGIVRRRRSAPRASWQRPKPPLPEAEAVLVAWLAGRRVRRSGSSYYWFLPSRTGAFRQGPALDEEEAARYARLPEWFREGNDPFSPESG